MPFLEIVLKFLDSIGDGPSNPRRLDHMTFGRFVPYPRNIRLAQNAAVLHGRPQNRQQKPCRPRRREIPLPPRQPINPPTEGIHGRKHRLRLLLREVPPSDGDANPAAADAGAAAVAAAGAVAAAAAVAAAGAAAVTKKPTARQSDPDSAWRVLAMCISHKGKNQRLTN